MKEKQKVRHRATKGKVNLKKALQENSHINVKSRVVKIEKSQPAESDLPQDNIVAQIPAIIADLFIQFNVHTIICLPEEASNVLKTINAIEIETCQLLMNADTLYIKGILKKQIGYSLKKYSSPVGKSLKPRYMNKNIPFELVSKIVYNGVMPKEFNNKEEDKCYYFTKIHNASYTEEFSPSCKREIIEINSDGYTYYDVSPKCNVIECKEQISNQKIHHREYPNLISPLGVKKNIEVEEESFFKLRVQVLQNREIMIVVT